MVLNSTKYFQYYLVKNYLISNFEFDFKFEKKIYKKNFWFYFKFIYYIKWIYDERTEKKMKKYLAKCLDWLKIKLFIN